MPIKDDSILGTGVLYSGDTPIGRINSVDVKTDAAYSECEETKKYIRNDDSFEAYFYVSIASLDTLSRLMFGSNNFRRMHKLPMISYKRYRHESKKRRSYRKRSLRFAV